MSLEIEDSGVVSDRDAAYPTAVLLGGGDLVAAFTLGGQTALGGTHWARSTDGGRSWSPGGTILGPGSNPPSRNTLRLSRTADGVLLAYGMRAELEGGRVEFGADRRRVPVLCRSLDAGRSWSEPEVLPTPLDCGWEVSNPIVELADGRWLAPAATLPDQDRLGERVVTFVSTDRGRTWPETVTVFHDRSGRCGFFEQKVVELEPGRLLATAWTVVLGSYTDLENHYALSGDGGRSWTPALPTGMRGQTLTPVPLGGDRVLALYNRRHGRQGIQGAIVRVGPGGWSVEQEQTVWDAQARADAAPSGGTKEFSSFAFGLPTAVRLGAGTVLALYWCRPADRCMVRWTRLRLA